MVQSGAESRHAGVGVVSRKNSVGGILLWPTVMPIRPGQAWGFDSRPVPPLLWEAVTGSLRFRHFWPRGSPDVGQQYASGVELSVCRVAAPAWGCPQGRLEGNGAT